MITGLDIVLDCIFDMSVYCGQEPIFATSEVWDPIWSGVASTGIS